MDMSQARSLVLTLCVLGILVGCTGEEGRSENTQDVHIDKIISPERQEIIVYLSEQLEKNPGIDAYLIAGSKIETDGSRMIMTVINSARNKVYKRAVTANEGEIQLGLKGRDMMHETFLDKGIPGGYRDDVFYQLNWDIDIMGREFIIGLGKELRRNKSDSAM